MPIPQMPPIGEAGLPIISDLPGTVFRQVDVAITGKMASPYRIEFRPYGGRPEAVQVLVCCEEADLCRAQVESCARLLLDERRSGEIHLVESATGRSLTHRPVWPAGEMPQPEWVAWSTHTLLPRL